MTFFGRSISGNAIPDVKKSDLILLRIKSTRFSVKGQRQLIFGLTLNREIVVWMPRKI
jgi:hypothetical protein